MAPGVVLLACDCPGGRAEMPLLSGVQPGIAGPRASHFPLLPQPSPPNLGFCAQFVSEIYFKLGLLRSEMTG